MTMTWFDSIESVRSFAGPEFETPVITEKAAAIAKQLRHWLGNADLDGVRGDAIEELLEDERADWRALWNDVADTLDDASKKAEPAKPAEKK